jgi:NTE family protein
MKSVFGAIFLFWPIWMFSQPKIGLTLSGGGAKGLAHIGILKAIDSAGIKVDYVTGTSMGSVIGSLYAIGYSGNQIEEIARQTDWKLLLSNQINLRSIAMEEKDEYGKYAIEVPFENGGFLVPSGAIESQELWLKLSQLYFPVYSIKNFDHFPKPFRAVAADIATGQPVVLGKGELISAIRASMAIPAVFTAVEIDGKKLVDGGIIRNLPVTEVKELGADFIIASNVSEELFQKEDITNPIQILYQIAFFRESEDSKKQVSLSDFYINQSLDQFSTGSFEKSLAIIDSGISKGLELLPIFQKIADSLNISKPSKDPIKHIDSILILNAFVNGLENEKSSSFLKNIQIEKDHWYSPIDLSNAIRRSFATLNYEKITYQLESKETQQANIYFDVKENPPTKGKLSIHYNTFTGLSVIGNWTVRNFIPNSRSLATVNLGENFRIKLEHLQYPGPLDKIAFINDIQSEVFQVTRYQNFRPQSIYNLNNFRWNFKIQAGSQRLYTYGLGSRFERIHFSPTNIANQEVEGKNRFFTHYIFFQANTLDKNIYPNQGVKIYTELRSIAPQKSKLSYFSGGFPFFPLEEPLKIQSNSYFQSIFQLEIYKSLNPKNTLLINLQNGFSFNELPDYFNAFYLGGINPLYRNQIIFPGLPDYSIQSANLGALNLGLRRQLTSSIYLSWRSGTVLFEADDIQLATSHALSFAYNSIFGPVEFSATFSEKTKKILPYVNVGFSF